ncbi:glycosyltransferase involved in cell wall biosynthesis [Nocardioides aromaticivorans]|uniref:Glycosyltransferase involved in cell wall biosynthesis n=1 Tax=Nocardioides aromaticivorans TaxID=200618 RepID=A0A7Y9ZIP7_9ACTN|nr:glycosyltransferase family 4 protein [Nocardioides aromaticivorans]NYI46174.1 glycosyltransferase involved in cell wall biosynthesis [Nocardioides aromaticivorans]
MTLHLLVPAGIDDPQRPSGGNVYDRRLASALVARGWTVREHRVGDDGPGRALAGLPDDALVLVDGLVASTTRALLAERDRLRLVVLLHMPGSGPFEPDVLVAARAVVTTSAWSRRWVLDHTEVPPDRVHVAVPGVDPRPLAAGSPAGGRLLTVGPVTPAKGYDDLLAALADLRDLEWRCRWVGALDLAPSFVDALVERAGTLGIADRLELTGPLAPAALDAVRADSDLVVAPSRRESWGMALAEGLACGLPAVATDVGGHPEALGTAPDGSLPGALVPLDRPAALAGALRGWLTDAALRHHWRSAAAERRGQLPGWGRTAACVAGVLNRIGPGVVHVGEG